MEKQMDYKIELAREPKKREKSFKTFINGRFDDSNINEIATIIITKW